MLSLRGLFGKKEAKEVEENADELLAHLAKDIDLAEPLLDRDKKNEQIKLYNTIQRSNEIKTIMNTIKINAEHLGSLSSSTFYLTHHKFVENKLGELKNLNVKFSNLTKEFVKYATILQFESPKTENLIKTFNAEINNLKSALIPIHEKITTLAKKGDFNHLGIQSYRYNILLPVIRIIEQYNYAFDQLSQFKPEPSNIPRP